MGKYVLYSHAGSENHGCEALLRTTTEVIKDVDMVYSGSVKADMKYGLDKIVKIKEDRDVLSTGIIKDLIYRIKYKIARDDKIYFRRLYRKFISEIDKDKIYVSIGGDNYCYHFSEWLEVLNSEINKKNAKSVLWGCSINKDELNNQNIIKDLKKYALITARESLTYDLLKERLSESNVKYVPDTAFVLPTSEVVLPKGFVEGRTIGINVSPVILNSSKNSAELLNGFLELVNFIIDKTDYQIALIPHVVIQGNDDRVILRRLYESCKNKNRVVLIEDASCTVLKGYISKCSLFIGARTHATIAAYSSFVPTLVIGYSIKSLGIAKDLFGSYENYVLPAQNIVDSHELIESFCWLNKNREKIKIHLINKIPTYISKIAEANKYLGEL